MPSRSPRISVFALLSSLISSVMLEKSAVGGMLIEKARRPDLLYAAPPAVRTRICLLITALGISWANIMWRVANPLGLTTFVIRRGVSPSSSQRTISK